MIAFTPRRNGLLGAAGRSARISKTAHVDISEGRVILFSQGLAVCSVDVPADVTDGDALAALYERASRVQADCATMLEVVEALEREVDPE